MIEIEIAGDRFEWRTRDEWGARQVSAPADVDEVEERVYVHHEGGAYVSAGLSVEQECAKLRDLQRWCIDDAGQGWSDLPYNVVVFPSGRVYEGRGWSTESAATGGDNDASKAILVAGNYDRVVMPLRARQVVALVVAWAARERKVVAMPDVRGHREAPQSGGTSCPGLTTDMNELRRLSAAALAWQPSPPPEGDPDMLDALVRLRFRGYWNVFLVGGTPTHLTPELDTHYRDRGVPAVVSDPTLPDGADHPTLTNMLAACGLTRAQLVASDGS